MRNKLFKRSYNTYAWEIIGQNGKKFEITIDQDYFYNINEDKI